MEMSQPMMASGSVHATKLALPWWGYVIGGFEIIGGIAGIGVWASAADGIFARRLGQPVLTFGDWLLGMVMLCLFVVTAVAGALLLIRRRVGWLLSRAVQAAQLVQFNLFGVTYLFASGAHAAIGWSWPDQITFRYQVGSTFEIWVGTPTAPFFVAINGVAVVLFGLLMSAPNNSSPSTRVAG